MVDHSPSRWILLAFIPILLLLGIGEGEAIYLVAKAGWQQLGNLLGPFYTVLSFILLAPSLDSVSLVSTTDLGSPRRAR